jgi:hypothetical protein
MQPPSYLDARLSRSHGAVERVQAPSHRQPLDVAAQKVEFDSHTLKTTIDIQG